MARPYSQDLRERRVRAVVSGQSRRELARRLDVGASNGIRERRVSSRREVARRLDVGASWGIKLMQRRDATGACRPRKFGGDKRHALAGHEDKARALVAEKPDLTITEPWRKIAALGIKVGRSAVARFLAHLQLTFKKNPACRRAGAPGRQGRPRGGAARCRKALILEGLCLSTRPGPRPT